MYQEGFGVNQNLQIFWVILVIQQLEIYIFFFIFFLLHILYIFNIFTQIKYISKCYKIISCFDIYYAKYYGQGGGGRRGNN